MVSSGSAGRACFEVIMSNAARRAGCTTALLLLLNERDRIVTAIVLELTRRTRSPRVASAVPARH